MVWPREAAIVLRLMDLGVSHATQVTRKGSKIDDACDLVWLAFDPRSYLFGFSRQHLVFLALKRHISGVVTNNHVHYSCEDCHQPRFLS